MFFVSYYFSGIVQIDWTSACRQGCAWAQQAIPLQESWQRRRGAVAVATTLLLTDDYCSSRNVSGI